MFEWLASLMPASVQALLAPPLSPAVLIALGVFSVVTFAASLIGVPYFLTRLPPDHFTRTERMALGLSPRARTGSEIALAISKNALGLVLLLTGILMLVLPGQALLTILVALLLLDFPGKRRFERWVIGHPRALLAINILRKRAGKLPLLPRSSWVPPAFRDSENDSS